MCFKLNKVVALPHSRSAKFSRARVRSRQHFPALLLPLLPRKMATAAAYPHAFYPLHGHHLQDHEVGPSLTLINLWLRTRGFNENDFRSGAVVALDMTTTTPMHRAAYEDDLDIACGSTD